MESEVARRIINKLLIITYNYYEINQSRSIISAIKPDLVISNLIYADRLIYKCHLSIPHIVVDQGDYRKAFSFRMKILNSCSHIVCVSESNKHLMMQYHHKNNIQTIYNAYSKSPNIINKTRTDWDIPEDAFIYIMVARGIREKGWLEAIVAFSKIKESSNSYFILVGDGIGVNEAKEYAKENKVNNIRFTGLLTNPESTFKMADVAILPSYFESESLPLTLVEALWSDIPLIATDIGGIREIVEDDKGTCGILIPLKDSKPDVDQLVIAMNEMHDNIQKYKKNIPYCRSKFDMKYCANQYLELSHRVIGQFRKKNI